MHPTLALFHRNAWATERLLNWCQFQPASPTPAADDVYGSIEATFNHILSAETLYLRLLTGEVPDDPVSERSPRPLAELRGPARRLAERWEAVLGAERDIESIRLHEREDGNEEMPDWLLLVQAVHHGDDHRAQIGTLLGRSGIITPELDGWSFGFEPGAVGTPPAWAETMLRRSVGHHLWATQSLLERCQSLTGDQLALSSPGTYGSILDTLNHLVTADRGYLSRLNRAGRPAALEKATASTLLEHWDRLQEGWLEYLDSRPDYESTVECSDGWYPGWILMLQAIHHGNDHRTHIGTVMLGHAIELPELDVWSYAWAEGSFRVATAS
jgi:uncharacterized damage-inducible protein DinB